MKIFGYVIIGILAVLALLLCAAVIKAVMIKKKPSGKESAIKYTPDEERLYAEKLSAMVRVPTVSAQPGETELKRFEEYREVLKKNFPNIFRSMEVIDIDSNLLLKLRGKDSSKQGVLFMGHQDVVPAPDDGTWKYPPFSGEIADGRVHGRGAMDCKSTMLAEWQALEELLSEGFVPETDLYLACSVNEENSGGGALKTVEWLKSHGIRLAFVMDEGGAIVEGLIPGISTAVAAAGVVEKGSAHIKFIARGEGGHSSTPIKNTPIARLSAFVCDIEKKNPFKKKFTPVVTGMFGRLAPYLSFPFRLLLGNLWLFKPLVGLAMPIVSPMANAFLRTTIVFTMSGGSEAANVIPNEAYVVANIRPAIHQNLDECLAILKRIAAKYDLETELVVGNSASGVTDADSTEMKYIEKCINACYPDYCFTPYYMAGGTDCRKYEPVSDNCIRLCPMMIHPDQMVAMHAPNENISTDALAQGVKCYKYIMQNYGKTGG
ncbi:MAG: M20/M25/M40 family metallo-hydrolase [Clostridia bacterium]|nr:M20/M25/M40 family metallo-hydrolase [Clostridia bacterium]